MMDEEFLHVGGLLRQMADDFARCGQDGKHGARMDAVAVGEFVHVLRGLAAIIEGVAGDYERLRRFEERLILQQQLVVGRAVLAGADVVMMPKREVAVLPVVPSGGDAA